MKKFFIATAILSIMLTVVHAQTNRVKPVANVSNATDPSETAMEFEKEVDLGLSVIWSGWELNPTDSPLSASPYYWGEVLPVTDMMTWPINKDYHFPCHISGTNYDAARYLWGEGWRMPTKAEVDELLALGSEYTTVSYGNESINCFKVTGTTGKSIVFFEEGTKGTSYALLTASAPDAGSYYAYRFYKDKAPVVYEDYRKNRGYIRLARAVKDRTPSTEKVTEIVQSDNILYVGIDDKVYVWAAALPETAGNRWLDFTSSNETIATVDSYGCVTGKAKGETMITMTATDGSGVSAECKIIVGMSLADMPELVDMGTDVMWSSKNLGAESASAIGNYYRYGETEPMSATDYQFATKPSLEGVQIKGNLSYDAATAALGEYYTTPSKQEFEELIANSDISLATIDEVKGVIYTSKTTGNALFFPASGYKKSNTPTVLNYSDIVYSRTSDYNAQSQWLGTKSYVFKDNEISEEDAAYYMPVRPVYKETVIVTAITLRETQLTLAPGDEYTVAATVSPEDATQKRLEWKSSDNAVATVDADGKITAVKDGSCVITVSATDASGVTAQVDVTVASPQYVDLGLSVMWGIANLDAESEYEVGGYYRLGDLTSLSDADYPFNQYVDIEGKTITGNPEYDAATAKMGENWCTPTLEMFQELMRNCDMEFGWDNVRDNGIVRFTSRINGKSIVIPRLGYYNSATNSEPNNLDRLYCLTSTFVPNTNVADPVKVNYLNDRSLTNIVASNFWCPIRPVYRVNRENVKVIAITLQETQLTLAPGDEYTVSATVSPEDATQKGLEWESSDDAIATVDADGKITAVKAGSCVITVSATDGSGVMAQVDVTVESPKYVDLGLSVMWGTANLGAGTEYEVGGYYRMGDLTSLSKPSYPFGENFQLEGKTITGNPEYDAAAAKMGDKWCTPTREMFQELIDNCEITQDWSSEHNIGYFRFTSKINGKSIVIPCGGYYNRVTSPMPSYSDELYSLTSTFVPSSDRYETTKVYYLNNKTLKNSSASNFWCPIRPVYKVHEVVEAGSLKFDKGHYDVKVGDEFDIIYTLLPENVTNKKLTWETTEKNKCCTVDENGHVTAVGVGTCKITATTANGISASCSITVTADPKDVAYVDMGTSVMWAESNLGASKPSETGDYYALCNIIKESKTNSWNLFGPNMVDNVVIANDPRYDAATANLGLAWHIPTAEEMQELIDNCTITTYALDGVMGKLFTSKTTGNTLFFPQSGRKYYLSKNPINEEDVMSMTSSWEGQLNLILLDNEVTSQSGDDTPLKRTDYCYTVRPVRAEAVEAERIEISARPKENSSDSYWLSATVYPENASCRNVIWTSSDPEAVTVRELNQPTLRDASAFVDPVAEGTGPWEVVAHAIDGSGVTGVYIINRGSASIEVVEIDLNMEYDVYDLLGRRVLVGALYIDLRQQLKPGFYILAGGDGSRIKIKI